MTQIFSDHPIYALFAFLGTALYLLKMLMFFISGDADSDFDVSDVDTEMDGGDNFSLISVQSILAFLMGMGWFGLAAQKEWALSDFLSFAFSALFGFLMMLMSAFITFKIKKFNTSSQLDLKKSIGSSGRAYTNIPKKGEGTGQVEITAGGKLQIFQAKSSSEAISSFETVQVVDVISPDILVVKKS